MMTAPPIIAPSTDVSAVVPETESLAITVVDLLNGHTHIFLAACAVTLLVTPLIARLAMATGIVDHPNDARKVHREPVAYLGGLAVFFGLVAAAVAAYFTPESESGVFAHMPMVVVFGMVAILFTGLADDIWGWDPRLKLAGQLVAAAALAVNDIGVRVAEGMLAWLLGEGSEILVSIAGFDVLNQHVFYWTGTALIAIFVLGSCNAANLIDGLDGLLSGVTVIISIGLLSICLLMAVDLTPELAASESSLAGPRIVLCLALLGAVLGFLPHNFNPATIFLGDCGSLLIGYMCAVIILMLGELGQTHLVFAGLIVFAIPIMDTTLAIVRRKLAGTSMSAADDQHLHHQLKRALGGVKRAVVAIYVLSAAFALAGVTLAWLVMRTELRVRVVYAVTLVLFSIVGVIAVKAARRKAKRTKASAKQAT